MHLFQVLILIIFNEANNPNSIVPYGPDELVHNEEEISTINMSNSDSSNHVSVSNHDSVISEDDMVIGGITDPNTKPTSKDWLQRHAEVQEVKATLMECEEKRKSTSPPLSTGRKITVGCEVSTRSKKIADLTKKKPGGHCTRICTYRVVLKQSQLVKSFWLVKFRNGKTRMCNERMLKFESNIAHSHVLSGDSSNTLNLKKLCNKCEGREHVLSVLCFSKVHHVGNYKETKYKDITKMFINKYAWLTESKLLKYVSLA